MKRHPKAALPFVHSALICIHGVKRVKISRKSDSKHSGLLSCCPCITDDTTRFGVSDGGGGSGFDSKVVLDPLS